MLTRWGARNFYQTLCDPRKENVEKHCFFRQRMCESRVQLLHSLLIFVFLEANYVLLFTNKRH